MYRCKFAVTNDTGHSIVTTTKVPKAFAKAGEDVVGDVLFLF